MAYIIKASSEKDPKETHMTNNTTLLFGNEVKVLTTNHEYCAGERHYKC